MAPRRVRAAGRDGADRRRAAAPAPHGRAATHPVGPRQLWRGARLPDQPGVCRRVRVRPHPPREDASIATAASASGTSRCRSRSGPSACPSTIPAMSAGTSTSPTRERLRANVRPRGEGGGAAREGGALLQGLVRCGRCGRRMQVGYAGTGGNGPPVRCACAATCCTPPTPAASRSAAAASRKPSSTAFLEAVTPAGVAATAGAIRELEDQHEQRLAGQRLALERAEYEAERARAPVRRLRAREPPRRTHPGTKARGRARPGRARARQADRARARPTRSRSPTRSATRSPTSRATSRACGQRTPRPIATASSCCAP